MELLNECYAAQSAFSSDDLAVRSFRADFQRRFILLLQPFAPYLANELWEVLGEKGNLLRAQWPQYDAALAKEEEIEIPVQVNGKLRSVVIVPAGAGEDVIKGKALADEKIKTFIAGKQIVKVIIVSGKLINIVVH
jgi:leucyl-tRNA synthetase